MYKILLFIIVTVTFDGCYTVLKERNSQIKSEDTIYGKWLKSGGRSGVDNNGVSRNYKIDYSLSFTKDGRYSYRINGRNIVTHGRYSCYGDTLEIINNNGSDLYFMNHYGNRLKLTEISKKDSIRNKHIIPIKIEGNGNWYRE